MPVIDADTHVDETEDTWDFLTPEDADFKPTYVRSERGPGHYWLIDGRRQRRRVRSDEATGTTKATRELLDVPARLRHMDELGVDVHVIYPTVFLTEFTTRAEVELALRRGYNRWLADRTGQSAEARRRLRWAMLPPLLSMDKTIEEMRWARDNGACGVLKKGDKEAGWWPAEEYFFPMYEEAERLGLTICFHIGGGLPDFTSAKQFSHVGFMQLNAPLMNAFHSLVAHSVPARFPKLRFAFVENGASWLPYCIYKLQRAHDRRQFSRVIGGPDYELGTNVLRENNFYVTCQVDEDVPYLLRCAGEDNLMIGSDYAHSDPSQEGDFAVRLREWARHGDIPDAAVDKMLWDNPRTCYGL